MAAFENSYLAGLKITTATEQKRYRTVCTEYFKAGFERIDQLINLEGKDKLQSTYVKDLARARLTIWHSDRPEYVVMRTDAPPAEPKPMTGAPELIDTKTTDTGERKISFGQPTRHLITEETRRWVPGELPIYQLDRNLREP